MTSRYLGLVVVVLGALTFSACGGSGSSTTPPPPPPATYTIGGTVTGLSGTGLVLQDNSGDNLTVVASATTFTFATKITSGGAYAVTVLTQPSSPAQTCTVTSGSGTATANVTTVQVACVTATFTVGGTVTGLSGTGLVLQNNGADNLTITANGAFTFATAIVSGGAYSVTVLTQPSAEMCTVTGGSGTVSANVTSVAVACGPPLGDTIGGTISGLSGSGLVLQDNATDNLSITTNGTFTFGTGIAGGGAYAVTVLTQPKNPAQTCTVTGGSGTANANVTTVQVGCVNTTAPAWAWMDGANVINQNGVYGTLGMGAAGNTPGARAGATSWTDAAGDLWLFGGFNSSVFNDLWKYSGGQWTWVSGNTNPQGVYGTLGTAGTGNVPGARAGSVSWIDATGNLWLFGGNDGTGDWFNDLWKFSAGEWTWESGANTANQLGTYGTLGVAASANVPGARWEDVSWIDPAGNFWLFGGNGFDSAGTFGSLNDLWKYSGGQWTWMSGANVVGQAGVYGTLGVAAPSNVPGARNSGTAWADAGGALWLFGGFPVRNDLWRYSSGQWTWMSGSSTGNGTPTYGTLGIADPGNVPGARWGATGWIDAAGNLWLFGGDGISSFGTGGLNDLWRYSAGEWTWMGGTNLNNQPGIYGTEGTAAANNLPGARWGGSGWIDPSGNFWVFGGSGVDSAASFGDLNDLWEYQQ
jgi:hypothetical protein